MEHLKKMVDDMANKNITETKKDFHGYLSNKLSTIIEAEKASTKDNQTNQQSNSNTE